MASSPSLVTGVYFAVPLLTALACVAIGWYIRRRHWDERGARSFVLMLGAATVWMLLLFGHLASTDPDLQLLLASGELVAAQASFATFGLFCSRYTKREFHRERWFQAAFLGLTGGFAVLTATNPWHGLVYHNHLLVTEPFHYVVFGHGPAWVATLLLVAVVNGYSSLALTRYLLSSSGQTGMQLVMLLFGGFLIALAEILGRVGTLPAAGLHHAAYGTALFIVLATLALFRFRLLDIQPVARNAVVETLRDPVVMLDSDRRVVDANREARRIWPDIDASVGDPVTEACPFLADAVAFPTGRSRTTTRLTLPVGDDQFHYSVQVSAVRRGETDAAVDWYAIVLRDVTELEQSRWQLERQNERLDQVAATISHDLRNPITVADGSLEVVRTDLLADDDPDPGSLAEARDYLDDASGSLTRMEQIIDDVLTLAREGQTVTETEDLDLETVVEDAWSNVDTREATLRVQGSLTVEADRGRLLTIFENLMRNALDHGPDDVTVEVGTTETGFYVADDGPGIPEDSRADVFEYGFTTDDDGTGLGLSIVRTMAESHGWAVALDADYDGGARFVFDTSGGEPVVNREPETEPEPATVD